MLEISDLRAGYGRIPILNGVSLTVADGEFVGILGHNGMDKTTLLKAIMGYLPATGGHIGFAGIDVTHAAPYRRARLGLGYVPQGREIFADFTAEENLLMGVIGKRHLPNRVPSWAYNLFPILRERQGQERGDDQHRPRRARQDRRRRQGSHRVRLPYEANATSVTANGSLPWWKATVRTPRYLRRSPGGTSIGPGEGAVPGTGCGKAVERAV